MSFAPLTEAQQTIATAVEHWCTVEGMATARTVVMLPSTPLHGPATVIQLDLGDSWLWIRPEGVTVYLPGRIVEVLCSQHAEGAALIRAVVETLERG